MDGKAVRVIGTLCALGLAGPAAAQTVFTHYDEATGVSSTAAAPAYHLQLSGSPTQLWLSLAPNTDHTGPREGDLEFLYVSLAPPPGETFRPGVYPEVGCRGLATGRSAAMQVTAENPVCLDRDRVWGWISIRAIEFDDAGRLVKLDAAFNQRLDGPDNPGRIMTLRHNAAPQSFTLAAGRATPFGAIQRTFFGDEAFFHLAGSGAWFSYASQAPKQPWTVHVRGPEGRPLAPGRYETMSPMPSATGWTMDVAQRGAVPHVATECTGPGVLEIREVAYDDAGQLQALRASFQQTCGSRSPARFHPATTVSGEIRHHR